MSYTTNNDVKWSYQTVDTKEKMSIQEKEEEALINHQLVETCGSLNKSSTCGKLFLHVFITIAISLATGLSWACGRQFTKTALNIDSTKFYAPYSLVYFNTCFMSICYPVFLVYNKIFNGISTRESHFEASQVFGHQGLTLQSFIKRTTLFLVLWLVPNYTYSHALGYISASAAFCIVSSNVAIVCVLGWIILKNEFSLLQLIAAVIAVLGVTVISVDKKFAGSLFGIGLAVLCAFSSAFYKVLFKLIIGNASLGQVSLFMSSLGMLNMTLNLVPTTILVLSGAELVEWDYIPWQSLSLAAFLSLTFNFLTNFGIALFGPLVISVGMLCGIPASALIDILFRQIPLTQKFLVGSAAVMVSFVLIAFPVKSMWKQVSKMCCT